MPGEKGSSSSVPARIWREGRERHPMRTGEWRSTTDHEPDSHLYRLTNPGEAVARQE
jgi:hypothetical protein